MLTKTKKKKKWKRKAAHCSWCSASITYMWSLCAKRICTVWFQSHTYIHMHTNSLYTWLFHTCHLFSVHISHLVCNDWPVLEFPFNLCKVHQMTLTFSRSKVPTCLPHFTLWCAIFELQPNFGKSALNDPKMTLTCSRSKVPIWILHIPMQTKTKKIKSVSPSYDEPFSSHGPTLGKVHPMTPTCSRWKRPICIVLAPPVPKFSSVLLCNRPFLNYDPILWKVHRMTPNDLDILNVKDPNTHAM